MNRFDNKRVLEMIEKMDIEEKLLCVHGQLWDPYRANQAGFVRGNKRLGIPDFFIADGESGVFFWISGPFTGEELIQIGESLEKREEPPPLACMGPRRASGAGTH